MHTSVRCNGCSQYPLKGRRYKCLTCNDFDYCEYCYYANKFKHTHNFNVIRVLRIHNATCNGCSTSIVGMRYQCQSCYNFDYCLTCLDLNNKIHNHQFTAIP